MPQTVKIYERKWDIQVGDPFPLSYNYVAPAKRENGMDVVLKIGFPGDRELLSEMNALKIFHGEGSPQLLELDKKNAVFLEERVIPGVQLATIENDEQATIIAVDVVKKLWRVAPDNYSSISLEQWFEGFARYKKKFQTKGPIPWSVITKGETVFNMLLKTTQRKKLLHGDFHHQNILLSKDRGWIAIDPKGIIGDPVYDIAVFLYNPIPTLLQRPDVRNILKKRIEIFSGQLGFNKQRIQQWAIAQAILSAIWSVEDGGDPTYSLHAASLFEEISW